ncbi:hypothetical protein KM043_007876 [Ampulex compressa]|nr:hypothetical protein KM043_007876 [Ampulex compressa]
MRNNFAPLFPPSRFSSQLARILSTLSFALRFGVSITPWQLSPTAKNRLAQCIGVDVTEREEPVGGNGVKPSEKRSAAGGSSVGTEETTIGEARRTAWMACVADGQRGERKKGKELVSRAEKRENQVETYVKPDYVSDGLIAAAVSGRFVKQNVYTGCLEKLLSEINSWRKKRREF